MPSAATGPVPVETAVGRRLELVVGGTGPGDVSRLLETLRPRVYAAAGRCSGPGAGAGAPTCAEHGVVVPIGPQEDPEEVRADLRRRLGPLPPATDLILRTSGSTTGTGSLVAAGMGSLVCSAQATHSRLGGPGTWVLALATHHVAGLQVLVRSLLAGREPVVVDTSGGFGPTALAEGLDKALSQDPDGRVYVSLVPTQLLRVLRDPAASTVLARAAAVLVGGAGADPRLLRRARSAGVRVVTTYGMSETGGGCVYDGRPLDGVEVWIEHPDEAGVGRIGLSGPVLAEGYAHRPPPGGAEELLGGGRPGTLVPDPAAPGPSAVLTWRGGSGTRQRVLLTADQGRIDADGRLHVLGRLDDLIVTGGVKVSPREVEEVLGSLPGVAEACVVGLAEPRWGTAVVAVVVPEPGVVLVGHEVRTQARERLDGPHTPKHVVVVDRLPLRGPGKVDRRGVEELATDELHAHLTAPW